jgi:hypothetical protein
MIRIHELEISSVLRLGLRVDNHIEGMEKRGKM